MSKYFRNRKASEWRTVLIAFGYKHINSNGDDQVWAKEGCNQVVLVPGRDSEVIILQTAMDMSRKVGKCGISKKDVLKWWKENGYGE